MGREVKPKLAIGAFALTLLAGTIGYQSAPRGSNDAARVSTQTVFDSFTYPATVDFIIDGDTVEVTATLTHDGLKATKRVRLARIDAPEIRGAEKIAGRAATEYLHTLIGVGDSIVIRVTDTDNFGRWIAEIETWDGLNVSDAMLRSGYAEVYR